VWNQTRKLIFHPVYAYNSKRAGEFATLYRHHHLRGGHVIKLGPGNDDAAKEALRAWPGETACRYGRPQGLMFCPKMLSISAAGLQRTTVYSGSKREPRKYLTSKHTVCCPNAPRLLSHPISFLQETLPWNVFETSHRW
jgi:hypothetical protein